ncbi:MAG: hypothetical protein R3Y49_02935 [Rikenellaceae bacterium]
MAQTKKSSNTIIAIIVALLVGLWCYDSCDESGESKIEKMSELGFLNDIEDVAWWCVVDNNIAYIGFSDFPTDVKTICNSTAFQGNKALGFGFHVFAVDAKAYPNYQALINEANWKYNYEVTYRHGKIEK